MQRRLVGTLGVWVAACAALVAADFWEEKDFTTWSDKEVEKMLTDSPWSREVRIVLSGPVAEGNSRMRVSAPGPNGPGGFGGGGGGRGGGFNRPVRRAEVTVSWIAALPVKQAQVRSEIGIDARIPPESQELLSQIEPYYLVSVSELPPPFVRLAQDIPAVVAEAELRRKDKEPISPYDVQIFRDDADRSIQVVYRFPKTDEITLDDKDVEFVTKLSGIDVRKKFKLKDMVFGDQLAL